jgi:hypothetical protein
LVWCRRTVSRGRADLWDASPKPAERVVVRSGTPARLVRSRPRDPETIRGIIADDSFGYYPPFFLHRMRPNGRFHRHLLASKSARVYNVLSARSSDVTLSSQVSSREVVTMWKYRGQDAM